MNRIIIASMVLFLAACANDPKNKKAELEKLKKEQKEINNKISELETALGENNKVDVVKEVDVYIVKTSEFKSYTQIQGKIDAEQNVQVSPQAAGIITKIAVNIGQNVSKGQFLAQIDDAVLQQNIAQLQTSLDLANNLFNRQKNLWDQKIGTEVQYLNAKTQRDGLERQMSMMKQQAAMYKIKAPISGTIDLLDFKIGQAVQPGVPGLRIVNANDLKAKALVSENYAGKISEGDEVLVLIPDASDSIKTKISFAAKFIDPISRSFNVEVKLPSKKAFRPNMITILNIVDYTNKNANSVPLKAILKSESGNYLLINENGIAKRRIIKVGHIYNGFAEILSGINAGDQVIVNGLNDLNEGDPIKI